MIIEHVFRNTSAVSVEFIEENIASHPCVDSVRVEWLAPHNDYVMIIDISDDGGAFYVGQELGHYELGLKHGIIKPRKPRIYGKDYKKEYPIGQESNYDTFYSHK